MSLNFVFVIIIAVLVAVIITLAILLGHKKKSSCHPAPVKSSALKENWDPALRPPSLDNDIMVYVSAPLFNLSETLYAIGVEGITKDNHVSLVDTLCNLSDAELGVIRGVSNALGLPPYGIAGEIAKKGWYSYIPARDGFVLAKFIAGVTSPGARTLFKDDADVKDTVGYLTKAIYSFDMFALGSLCNTCIFNSDGLQIDDGSATEIGMVGMRGMPTVFFRDQATDQFGPSLANPMLLGNANSLMFQKPSTVQDAVALLGRKIDNIKRDGSQWWAGKDYPMDIPPPPLALFWLEIGNAVFNVRYKNRLIQVDPTTGLQDYKASSTPFFYSNYYFDNQGNRAGEPMQLAKIALKIREEIKKVEDKWKDLIIDYAGCTPPFPAFEKIITQGCT